MKEDNKKSIVRSASVLGIGVFISKVLGAVYRIPLTNYLGGLGIGLYQMVFPIYALLLDFSGCAVPSAISRLIAKNQTEKETCAKQYLTVSLKLLAILGVLCSLFMLIFAKPLARMQGNSQAYLGYVFLAPAVLLVSLISCFRGYFQGLFNMLPTALSQIIEQVVKLIAGIILVKLFMPNVAKAVAGATFAITVSEVMALIYLFVTYKVRKTKLLIKDSGTFVQKDIAKKILKTALPITLIGIMIPFSQVIDSFITVNVIGIYRQDATTLYGLLSGVVLTVVNLPVSVCHAVATAAIPNVSSQKNSEQQNKSAIKALVLTIILSLPCMVFCYFFAPFIVKFLFKNLPTAEKIISIKLLKLTAPCVLLLSILQTLNAILIGKGKLYTPILSLGVGIAAKTFLNLILLKNPSINIYGNGIALITCYFLAVLINLIMIFKLKVKNETKHTYRREYAS